MWTIGIDAHYRLFVLCVLNEKGEVVKEETIKGSPGDVARFVKGLRRPSRICFEASCGYGTLYGELTPVAREVVVAHPGQLRLIFRAKQKHDRVDARKLAKLLYLGEVPRVHVPTLDVRSWRGQIEFRRGLVTKSTRAKNALRALVRTHAIVAPRGDSLWSRKGRAWAAALELPPLEALKRDMLLREIEFYRASIREVQKRLDEVAEAHAGVALLRTIPGVGPRTAEAFVAYVDKPERFGSARLAGSYFGLVPSLDQSAGKERFGHITREGPGTVRWLLTEAAWRAVRLSPSLRAFYERVLHGKKERKPLALIATARHLSEVMLAMLKSGVEWEERRAEKKAA
ncbi:MAG: IS110 family transposase [Phycisphaerae bacterium]|nr:IS110 family transposase [Phycisphaerae bacterium]